MKPLFLPVALDWTLLPATSKGRPEKEFAVGLKCGTPCLRISLATDVKILVNVTKVSKRLEGFYRN